MGLLFSDGTRLFGLDFYESVTEVEVIRTYAKRFDSGARVNIVCVGGEATEQARRLALALHIRILTPKAVGTYFVSEPFTTWAR